MKKTTLVIMAAGIGSRFGGGIKQLAPVGMNDEIIMDYSIHDAIKAGFNHIIFVIREDIHDDFMDVIGNRILAVCKKAGVKMDICYQDMSNIPEGYSVPEGRTKPWGTGHAVLAAQTLIDSPFAVINADDYYGTESFENIHDFLVNEAGDCTYCMAGFVLKNTLSENGSVTRGICLADDNNHLISITETSDIQKSLYGAVAGVEPIDANSLVSMNMFGFGENYKYILEGGFIGFLDSIEDNDLKSEFLLPVHLGQLLKDGKITIEVLPTNDKWLGVTYKEDQDYVHESLVNLTVAGVYDTYDLFFDL